MRQYNRDSNPGSLLSWKNNVIFTTSDEAGRLLFWDIEQESSVKEVKAHDSAINCLEWDSTGSLLGSSAGSIVK